MQPFMETETAQPHKQSPDCAATIYGNGNSTAAQTVPRLYYNHLWKRKQHSRTNSPPTVLQPFMETETAQPHKQSPDCAATTYGNGMLLPSNTNGYIFKYVTARTKTIYRNG